MEKSQKTDGNQPETKISLTLMIHSQENQVLIEKCPPRKKVNWRKFPVGSEDVCIKIFNTHSWNKNFESMYRTVDIPIAKIEPKDIKLKSRYSDMKWIKKSIKKLGMESCSALCWTETQEGDPEMLYVVAKNTVPFRYDIVELNFNTQECKSIGGAGLSLELFYHKDSFFYVNESMRLICRFSPSTKKTTRGALRVKFFSRERETKHSGSAVKISSFIYFIHMQEQDHGWILARVNMDNFEEKAYFELSELGQHLDAICADDRDLYVVDKSSLLSRLKVSVSGEVKVEKQVKVTEAIKAVPQLYEEFKRTSAYTKPIEDWNHVKLAAAGGYLAVPDDHNHCLFLFEGRTLYPIQCIKAEPNGHLAGLKMWPSLELGATFLCAFYSYGLFRLYNLGWAKDTAKLTFLLEESWGSKKNSIIDMYLMSDCILLTGSSFVGVDYYQIKYC